MLHEAQSDLASYDRDYPRSAAAPSPISESMGDIFDDDDLEDNNEIDRLWANNVFVDGPTFSRLFETTVSKMDASLNESGQAHIISAAQGLRKLREFDESMFDRMIFGWMRRMRSSSHCSSFFKTVSLLISSSSVEINVLAQVALATDLMDSDSVRGSRYMDFRLTPMTAMLHRAVSICCSYPRSYPPRKSFPY